RLQVVGACGECDDPAVGRGGKTGEQIVDEGRIELRSTPRAPVLGETGLDLSGDGVPRKDSKRQHKELRAFSSSHEVSVRKGPSATGRRGACPRSNVAAASRRSDRGTAHV